jgi:hypothetical protein
MIWIGLCVYLYVAGAVGILILFSDILPSYRRGMRFWLMLLAWPVAVPLSLVIAALD